MKKKKKADMSAIFVANIKNVKNCKLYKKFERPIFALQKLQESRLKNENCLN